MATTHRRSTEDTEQLLVALLIIAGSWFVLDQALKAAERKSAGKPEQGSDWAKRVINEIEQAKKTRTARLP